MDDERLAKINQEKQNAINASNATYNQMLQDNQNLYNQQNEYANTYEKTQNETLDKQLAYQEGLIEQQKEIARENKEIEDKKAKNDYSSFINPYGYQAESEAINGFTNSGVSETAKLGGWNTYQNRLASANKAMQDAFTQYDNDMNEARMNNDVQKAQNALAKLQMQLGFAESFYTNKTNIPQNQLSNNQALDSEYNSRYNTTYNQILEEQARAEAIRQWEAEMAEQQRQYNESLAYQKQQDALAQANWEKEYALAKKSASKSSSSGSSSSLVDGNSSSLSSAYVNPYTGTINSDAQNGVFKNGYQPDNINGEKLKSTGVNVSTFTGYTGNTNSGNKSIDDQNVWKLNGKYYAWDGYQNKYVDITKYKAKQGC